MTTAEQTADVTAAARRAADVAFDRDPDVGLWPGFPPKVAAGFTLAIALLVLTGWQLSLAPLMSVLPGLVPMNPVSAVCFALAAVSLWALGRGSGERRVRWLGRICAAVVAGVGLCRLAGYALGWQAGVDQILFADALNRVAFAPNRMAPNTALNFALLGSALLLWQGRHWAARWPAVGCCLLTILASVLAIVGYANGVNSLYGVGSFVPMALHTAATFVALALGVLLSRGPADPAGADAASAATRRSLERKITFGFGAALFMAVAVGVSAFLSIAQFSRDTQWAEHTHVVLTRVADLTSALKDAETGGRGFVISGEDQYLQPYRDSLAFIESSLGTLRTETADNANQQRRLDALRPLVERRLANLRATILLRGERRGFDEAGQAALAGEGKRLMDAARAVLAQMRAEEEALLATRSAALASSTRVTVSMIVGGCVLAFVLVGFAGFVIRRDMAARAVADLHVRTLNLHLDRHAAQLEAANKELEAFSYSVSHDLRAPLRSIDGFSKAVLEDYGDKLDADGHDHLRRVCGAADRMGRLIDDMLNLSRVTRGELRHERVDLAALARAVAADLRAAQPDRRADVVVAGGLIADGDPRLLRVVLDNLIGNAWKFTSKRPSARIEVGATITPDGERAFYVRDDGAGFDMAFSHKLFGAFQRLHAMDEYAGTGVGLATVQRIARRHGGRAWAEGAVGQGATFYFTLGAASV